MKIKIEVKDTFYVVGIEGEGPADKGFQWVPPLWEKADGFKALTHLSDLSIWGAMSDSEMNFMPWKDTGKYLAGCETSYMEQIPEGYTQWCIPSFKYVVVPCTNDTYGDVFKKILNEYFSEHHMILVGAVHERYLSNGEMLLYFPIERM